MSVRLTQRFGDVAGVHPIIRGDRRDMLDFGRAQSYGRALTRRLAQQQECRDVGVALFIVLDNDDPGFDTSVDGKAIGKAAERLNVVCESIGLAPIDSFISMSMDEVADMLGEDIPEMAENWFAADDGLDYFATLAAYLRENPSVLPRSNRVVADLDEYISILQQAREIGARWRLSMDI